MVESKPDIVAVLQRRALGCVSVAGGCGHVVHFTRKNSIFYGQSRKQRFHCFGCHVGGDVVDFVMKLKMVSFSDALGYLGISRNRQAETNPQETKRRGVVNKFREWCSNYAKYSSEMLRLCNRIDAFVKTPYDLEPKGIGEMYLLRDVYQYHLSILNNREDETKFELYKEVCYGNRNRKN